MYIYAPIHALRVELWSLLFFLLPDIFKPYCAEYFQVYIQYKVCDEVYACTRIMGSIQYMCNVVYIHVNTY